MKRNIAFIFLLYLSFYTNSQTTTFNKSYTPFTGSFNSPFVLTSIAAMGNSYVAAGVGFDTICNNYQSLFFYKIDSIGNISKIISFTQSGWNFYDNYSSLIKLKNGGYCYIGEMDTANQNLIHFIIRFDSNMNTLCTNFIPSDSIYWERIGQVFETSDNGLIFTGAKENNPYNLWVMLVKTDSLGNLQWKKTIPMNNYSGGAQIIETPDKGYLINGYTSSNIYKDGSPFVIKTDSAGNQEWLKSFGGNEYDGAGAIVATQDGNYLYAYGLSNYTFPYNEGWTARLNIIKFALNGSIIWNKIYDTIRTNLNVSKIKVLPNNNFITMGIHSVVDSSCYFITFLFKFNANGDSLWKKAFYIKKEGIVDENIMIDNVLNADGGITACGWVSSDTQVPRQQIWILKTDSTGYAPGPQNYVGIIDLPYLQLGYGGMRVYPNPATTQTTITYPIAEKVIMLQIYNMLGQMVYEEKLPKGSNQCTINTNGFKAGLYKVVVGESSGTLIIN